MKGLKWIIIATAILAVAIALIVVFTRNTPPAEPNEFSRSSSALVQDYWDDDFIGSIKLVIGSEDVFINGSLTMFDTRDMTPVVHEGSIFLPVGLIADLVMAAVSYDGDRNARIEAGENTVELLVGQGAAIVNGETEALAAATFIMNDRVMAPLGVMEFFGFDEPILNYESGDIVLMRAFQTFRLIVITNGRDLVETHGAIHVVGGPDNLYVLQYASEQAARNADELFNNDPDILLSQPDAVLHTDSRTQLTQDVLSWGVGRVGADYYTEQISGRRNNNTVVVAVLDTGIYTEHPFLSNRISDARWCFVRGNNDPYDVNGHGTHVSGIIVDSTPPNVIIMPLKVLGNDGKGTMLNVHNAIIYAVDSGADIINMSLGANMGRKTSCALTERAVDYALSRNVVVIASAGNENVDARHNAPAYYLPLITVAATDENDRRAGFSNFGDSIDIAAPGVFINSPIPGGSYADKSGTSMAAPFVAACAALLMSTNNTLTPGDIRALLVDNADSMGSPRYFGAGIVNVVGLVPTGVRVPVSGVTLSSSSVSLAVSSTERITATVRPSNATNPSVLWSSDNDAVATVQDGLITAIGPGNAVISARTEDGNFLGRCDVVVTLANISVTGVSLNKNSLLLPAGGTERLVASVLPASASNQSVIWETSDQSVARVSQNGDVTAISAGNAVITVRTADGNFIDECTVDVLRDDVPITGLSLDRNSLTLSVGGEETLIATVTPSYATNPRIIWRSDDRGVATVSQNGEVVAVAPGTTVITVHTFDERISSTCYVTVNP